MKPKNGFLSRDSKSEFRVLPFWSGYDDLKNFLKKLDLIIKIYNHNYKNPFKRRRRVQKFYAFQGREASFKASALKAALVLLLIGFSFNWTLLGQEVGEKGKPQVITSGPQVEDPFRKALVEQVNFHRQRGNVEEAERILDILFSSSQKVILPQGYKPDDTVIVQPFIANERTPLQWRPADYDVFNTEAFNEKHPWLDQLRNDPLKIFAVAEYWNGTTSPDKIRVKRSDNGGVTWPGSNTLDIDSIYVFNKPRVQQISNDYVGVVYVREYASTDWDIHFAKIKTDLSESTIVNIDASGGTFHDRVAITSDYEEIPGDPYIYVVYFQKIPGSPDYTYKLLYRYSTNLGESWSTPVEIDSFTGPSDFEYYCTIDFAQLYGAMYVAYTSWDASAYQIKVAKTTDYGSTWSKTTVASGGGAIRKYPRVVAADINRVWVFYEYEWTPTDRNIFYAYTTNGGTNWTLYRSLAITTADERHPAAKSYHVAGNYVFCSYLDMTNNYVYVYRTLKTSPTGWASFGNIKNSTRPLGGDIPGIALRATDHATVAWTEFYDYSSDYDVFCDTSWLPKARLGTFINGKWFLDYSANQAWDDPPIDIAYTFGSSGYTPVVGDWNRDGRTEIGTFVNGKNWFLDYNGNGTWDGTATDKSYVFGATGAGFIPVVGDWNGDGKAEIGVFVNGNWYLDYNGNGTWDGTPTDKYYHFGASGYLPVTGDWNGDGKTKLGVVYGGKNWFLDYNGNGTWDGTPTDKSYAFGASGYTSVAGDWNEDGKTEIGVYINGNWFVDYNGNGAWDGTATDRAYHFGSAGYLPVIGRW